MKKVFKKKVDETAKSLSQSLSVDKENLDLSQHQSVDIEQAFDQSGVVIEKLKLKDDLLVAFKSLPKELEFTLTNKVNRFFNKSEQYQASHLKSFVEGLVNTIDNYIAPPTPTEVKSNEAPHELIRKDYREIKHDVLANIALALASLLIFYPLVLLITSKVQGHSYGFYRFNDGRNEAYTALPTNLENAKEQLIHVLNPKKKDEKVVDQDGKLENSISQSL